MMQMKVSQLKIWIGGVKQGLSNKHEGAEMDQ